MVLRGGRPDAVAWGSVGGVVADLDCDEIADRDYDSTANSTSTATRSGTTGIFDRDSTAVCGRDSTAPRPPQPRGTLRTARPAPSRASRSRAPGCGSNHTQLGFITGFEHFYTPRRRHARHPLRPVLESDRTRSAGDRNRVVSERQRRPTRKSVANSRGGSGTTATAGFQTHRRLAARPPVTA